MPHAQKVSCASVCGLGIDSKKDCIYELTCLKIVNARKFKAFRFTVKQL